MGSSSRAVVHADVGTPTVSGFGPIWSSNVFETLNGRAAVGCVMFGFESMDRVAAVKKRYEAQMQ
jgi:hypothetical protein